MAEKISARRFTKKKAVLIVLVALGSAFLAEFNSSTRFGRWLYWQDADMSDIDRFAFKPVEIDKTAVRSFSQLPVAAPSKKPSTTFKSKDSRWKNSYPATSRLPSLSSTITSSFWSDTIKATIARPFIRACYVRNPSCHCWLDKSVLDQKAGQLLRKKSATYSLRAREKGQAELADHIDSLRYGYFWWGIERDGRYDFYANGRFGQFIYISPQARLVIVRNGTGHGGLNDWYFGNYFSQLASDVIAASKPL